MFRVVWNYISPVPGPIVNKFFSTIPGLNFDMGRFLLQITQHYCKIWQILMKLIQTFCQVQELIVHDSCFIL